MEMCIAILAVVCALFGLITALICLVKIEKLSEMRYRDGQAILNIAKTLGMVHSNTVSIKRSVIRNNIMYSGEPEWVNYSPKQIVVLNNRTSEEKIFPCSGPMNITIGRGLANDVVSDDKYISGRHCRIITDGVRIYAEDLHSFNGTYLNGRVVTGTDEILSGDTVTLGETRYTIYIRRARRAARCESISTVC